jgi:hypothetical protein
MIFQELRRRRRDREKEKSCSDATNLLHQGDSLFLAISHARAYKPAYKVSSFKFKKVRSPRSEVRSHKRKIKRQKAKIKTDPRPLAPDPRAEAEACFLKAIEIARKQQAKSLELRAVMSLARLRQQQATQPGARTTQHETRTKLDAARNTLSAIYGWFTEGFDTKDLQEAKALLENLQSDQSRV